MSRVKRFNYRLWFFSCESNSAELSQGLLSPLVFGAAGVLDVDLVSKAGGEEGV